MKGVPYPRKSVIRWAGTTGQSDTWPIFDPEDNRRDGDPPDLGRHVPQRL